MLASKAACLALVSPTSTVDKKWLYQKRSSKLLVSLVAFNERHQIIISNRKIHFTSLHSWRRINSTGAASSSFSSPVVSGQLVHSSSNFPLLQADTFLNTYGYVCSHYVFSTVSTYRTTCYTLKTFKMLQKPPPPPPPQPTRYAPSSASVAWTGGTAQPAY